MTNIVAPTPPVNINQLNTATPLFNWRAHLHIHPAAELFPLMAEAELKELAEDIKANGLIDPIVTWAKGDNLLLDGRNRLDALALAGLLGVDADGKLWNVETHNKIKLQFYTDGDPYAIALSLNVHRRHLTQEQKRGLIAKVLKAKPEQSDREIGRQIKVDHKTVATVRSEAEGRGEIPHVEKRTDAKGRNQPSKKKKSKPATVTKTAEESAERRKAKYAKTPEENAAVVSAHNLREFKYACKTYLPRLNEADLTAARAFVTLDEWRPKPKADAPSEPALQDAAASAEQRKAFYAAG